MISYSDWANGKKATVLQYNGMNWVPVGSPGFSAGQASDLSMALDSQGNPYVAYCDVANSYRFTVMSFEASAGWVPVGTVGWGTYEVNATKIAIYHDTPYIAYTDWEIDHGATVRRFNGTEWINVGSLEFTAHDAYTYNLVFNSLGTPYVALIDNNGARMMKFDGTYWRDLVPGISFSNSAQSLSMVVDSGTPYIAFRDGNNSDKATVRSFNGAGWSTLGSSGFSAGAAYADSLAFDGGGTPYLAYYDGGNNYKATVMKYSGSWTTVGSAGFSAGTAYTPSLAIYNSIPYVAYEDVPNTNKATVMKYVP